MALANSNPTARYLVNHALNNIWCRPAIDNQFRIKLYRLSGKTGVVKTFKTQWRTFNLPDDKNRYHIFMVGRHYGEDFNVGGDKLWWRQLSIFTEARGAVFNVYLEDGREIPISTVWTGNLENESMLIAILDQPNIADFGEGNIYWRTYENANILERQDTPLTTPEGREVHSVGGIVTSSGQVLQWQRQYKSWQQEAAQKGTGWARCYVNGVVVPDIPPGSFKVGDSVQVVYDRTVIKRYLFKVEDLQTYNSELDSKIKYLIHPPKDSLNRIMYRDDVDIYIFGPKGKGHFYHGNLENSLRMVTHRDYGIPTDYVAYFVGLVPDVKNVRDITIEVTIRDSGLNIPLVFEHNRIHELYKLDDATILRAMLGLDANIPEFSAKTLENSNYTRIMREYHQNVTADMVTDAYGYNAMAKLVADAPQLIDNTLGFPSAPVPWGLRQESTYFEYDEQGLLLGFAAHPAGQYYYPKYEKAHYVEGRSGVGGRDLDYVLGTADVPIKEWASYRCYKATLYNGEVVKGSWVDVTEDESVVVETNGVLRWGIDSRRETGLVLFDTKFLAYTTTVSRANHNIWLDITTGMGVEYPLPFQPGQIELWLGDAKAEKSYSLVQGIDYVIQWPTVVINAKRFITEGNVHTVTVRCTGFPQKDLTHEPLDDTGWVMHDKLSYDDVFNVRDDHVVRIIAGGRLFTRAEVVTPEDTSQPASLGLADGTPYSILRVIAPIRGLLETDTYYLRERSLETDKRVSEYMSLHFPAPQTDDPLTIANKYQLLSPTLQALTWDVVNGGLTPEPDASEQRQTEIMKAYAWLYPFDPALQDFDERLISIHPHELWKPIDVSLDAYRFLEQLSRRFLRDKVDFTKFFTVQGE